MNNKIGVIGCGTMGAGIALTAALNGYNVEMLDINMEYVNKGISKMKTFTDKSVERGKLTPEEQAEALYRMHGTVRYEDLAECSLVIEAAAENLEIKKNIFKSIEDVVHEDTVIASNTSSLPIKEISEELANPEKVVGIHFFNPPQLMKLVEIVSSDYTSEETRKTARAFAESLGKTAIDAKDNPGFIVNYLQYPFRLNAIRMVEKGLATPQDIDTAAKLGLGHPKGPLELQDMVGLDITFNACKAIFEATGDPLFEPPELMKEMVDKNLLGRKTGKGFYTY